METRVERGQAREDRVTGAIERHTSVVPSSNIPRAGPGLNGGISSSEIIGQESLGAFRRPVGRAISYHGELQQDGETARIGCDEPP